MGAFFRVMGNSYRVDDLVDDCNVFFVQTDVCKCLQLHVCLIIKVARGDLNARTGAFFAGLLMRVAFLLVRESD